MRLIDADELRKQWSADDACEHDYTHLHFLASIDSAPTIDRWIPITEGLPEALVDVIATDGEKVLVAWIGYNGVWYGGGASHIKLTAWMPLPKPYEGSEKSD